MCCKEEAESSNVEERDLERVCVVVIKVGRVSKIEWVEC